MSTLIDDNRLDFQGTVPRPTMIDVLRSRAEAQGGRPVFTYLANGEDETVTQTFATLDSQARSVAALLQRHCHAGDRALLLYPPCEIEFVTAFIGCLYAGVVAVPMALPHPARLRPEVRLSGAHSTRIERTLSKVMSIASDARPTLVLTTQSLHTAFESVSASFELTRSARWTATDGLGDELADEWVRPSVDEFSLALLQYTSGSTASPKGVMVNHGGLLHNARYCEDYYAGPDDVLVSWLPTFHDLGLIYGILQPIFTGFRCYLMPPAAFIQRPVRWLRAISGYGGTHGVAPNFAYDLCVRKTTAEDRASLDLSRWRVAMNGAEPVRRQTLDRFSEAFAVSGFHRTSIYPVYGLAEATLKVSAKRCQFEEYEGFDVRASALEQHRVVMAAEGDDARDLRSLVGCGTTWLDVRVIIVNPETRIECAADEVGEIWVSSPSVAAGYWDQPELSERTFRARLASGEAGSYLRTGDLGFLIGGQLVITGRLKDLIIIGGANYYPQDLELTVEQSHPDLRPGCSAIFSIDVEGEEHVAVAVEVWGARVRDNVLAGDQSTSRGKQLKAAVRRALAEEHQVQVHCVALIKAGSIPKTSSGKIQRQACRKLFLEGRLDFWGA